MLSVIGLVLILALANGCDDLCTNHQCSDTYQCRIKYSPAACEEEPCEMMMAQPVCLPAGKDAANPCKFGNAFVDKNNQLFECNIGESGCPPGSICENDPVVNVTTCCSRCHNPGECPDVARDHDVSKKCHKECGIDGECGAVKKCCFNGCGSVCVDPIFN